MPTDRTVAVLGTGIIGAAVARNLARAGFDVRVWNRTRSKAEPLTEDGAVVADTPADAVRGAGFVLTALNDGPRVLEAVRAAAPGLAEGTVWAQLSTVGVDAVAPLADFAAEHGLVFIDAPVQGTRQPAEQGQLVVMASGPESVRDAVAPVFDVIGRKTVWVADDGAGAASSRLKLALMSWAFVLTHGAAEALAIARGLGVDPQDFLEVVTGGPTDNPYLQAKGAAILADDYTTSFAVTNAEKDSRLIVEAAEQAGVKADLAVAGLERFRRAAAAGHGDKDMAASYLASFE
ncbi:NAD(P)-dependent oxidoreductase [Saccharopolyspora taberi]|uniref:NAD(P)-dependent oxidoreductase n=1 Tax=Saccharopolyspora taberi TaxID=60895 RepID=A0ABN3VDC2_9PSEU